MNQYLGSLCLGVFPKRTAQYLRSVVKENPKCNVHLVFRGRGSRKEHGDAQDLPVKYAEKVAVYVRHKNLYKVIEND